MSGLGRFQSADAAYHIGEPETREIEFVPPTPEQQQMLDTVLPPVAG